MPSKRVFITGATGFIGAAVLDKILKAGYKARISVRREAQIAIVKSRHPDHLPSMQFIVIPDFTRLNAFEDAFETVDFVFHIAGPMIGAGAQQLQREFIDPTVQGTKAVLEAANDHPTVQTVFLISSIQAIGPITTHQTTDTISFNDNAGKTWSTDVANPTIAGMGKHSTKHYIAKVLAHEAARNFMQQGHPHFQLISFHPVFVVGHDLTQTSFDTIKGPNRALWKSLAKSAPQVPDVLVDVEDVADAFVSAIKHIGDIESGTEIALAGPKTDYNQVYEFIQQNYPNIEVAWKTPVVGSGWFVDNRRATSVLGIQWKDPLVTITAMLDQQLAFAVDPRNPRSARR